MCVHPLSISQGEQLYNRYGVGTDNLFRDYGFVERTPELWSFTVPESIVDGTRYDSFPVRFWLDYENSVEGSQLGLQWTERPASMEAAKFFFNQERERLVSVKEWFEGHPNEIEDIPGHEKDRIWTYHYALSTALWGAAEAIEKEAPAVNDSSESDRVPPAAEAATGKKAGHGDEL